MKLMKYMAAVAIAALAAGCGDLDKVRVSENMTAPVLEERGAVTVTEENFESTETVKFSWKRADYGFDDAAEYILYGTYEGETERIYSGYGSSMEIVIGDFNAAMMALGLPADQAVDVNFYVVSQLSDQYGILESNRITVSVTSYSTEDYIYMPGSYETWEPGDARRLYVVSLRSEYTGCVNLVNGDGSNPEFKFTHGPSWDKNWGGTLANLEFNSSNNIVTDPGFYMMTFRFTDYAANQASVDALKITSIGIIGDAIPSTGWDSETQMTQDPSNPYLFTLTGLQMVEGGYKFRFNNKEKWEDGSLGGTPDNLTTSGNDIQNTLIGTFDITLDMSSYPYKATIQ